MGVLATFNFKYFPYLSNQAVATFKRCQEEYRLMSLSTDDKTCLSVTAATISVNNWITDLFVPLFFDKEFYLVMVKTTSIFW